MIDYFYKRQHRRLRERFGLAAIERHEVWVMRALEKRNAEIRKYAGPGYEFAVFCHVRLLAQSGADNQSAESRKWAPSAK